MPAILDSEKAHRDQLKDACHQLTEALEYLREGMLNAAEASTKRALDHLAALTSLVGAQADQCAACGKPPTKILRRRQPGGRRFADFDDACIADRPGVRFACCGHGDPDEEPCLELDSGERFYGEDACMLMRKLGGKPPSER